MLPYIIGILLCAVFLAVGFGKDALLRHIETGRERRRKGHIDQGIERHMDRAREEGRLPEPSQVAQPTRETAASQEVSVETEPVMETATELEVQVTELGRWPQSADGQVEPIRWRVLKHEDDKALLLAECILDYQPFHDSAEVIRYEDSGLRRWLTETFFEAAFDERDRAIILQPEAREEPPSDAMLWELFGMEDVTSGYKDRIFPLNGSDCAEFFPGGSAMFYPGASTRPTDWVQAKCDDDVNAECWWLRSSMSKGAMAYMISPADSMGVSAIDPENRCGVRPALWVLSAALKSSNEEKRHDI